MARKIEVLSRNLINDETKLARTIDTLARGVPAVTGVVAAVDPATISALTFSNPPTQAECEALRDKTADLATAFQSLRAAMATQELIGD